MCVDAPPPPNCDDVILVMLSATKWYFLGISEIERGYTGVKHIYPQQFGLTGQLMKTSTPWLVWKQRCLDKGASTESIIMTIVGGRRRKKNGAMAAPIPGAG